MATVDERFAEYEELFANRYTEDDEGYQKHIAAPAKPPPVVADWLNAVYDSRRRDDRNRGGGRDRGWDSRHGGDRDRRDRYDKRDQNRDNRDRGYGRHDYRDRGPRDNRNRQIHYKSSAYYEMYY